MFTPLKWYTSLGHNFGLIFVAQRYGELVATHPWKAIIACLAITIAGGSGLLRSIGITITISVPPSDQQSSDQHLHWWQCYQYMYL